MDRRISVVTWITVFVLAPIPASAQVGPVALAASRAKPDELRTWDARVDQMLRSRDLRVRQIESDQALPDRLHQRLDQYHRGVRIFGGDITRQLAADGTVSLFGILHAVIDLDVAPRLSAADARDAIRDATGGEPYGLEPELVVLPLSDGYHLAYVGQVMTDLEIVNVLVDANTGARLRQYSEFSSDGTTGIGKGTYGDDKKVSASPIAGMFVATDLQRPAEITTYDMKGNLMRTTAVLMGTPVTTADVASSANNTWTDSTVVDAHVYAGWYYDYLFKRFGRRGIDDRNLRIAVITHPVRLADIATAPPAVVGQYYLNAFFCPTCGPGGRGAVTFGEGAPRGFLAPNLEVKPFAAALDVVAHELTHAVASSTSRLTGFPSSESGALSEGFADIFGVSAAFSLLPPGTAPLTASYVQGRDLTVPAGAIGRSLSNPSSSGNPDHYTRRGLEIHFNSTIPSHAFYLAIEGGTNRTSGLAVQGVGGSNREQIEKVFFRALTQLLPSNPTFALARLTTIQAARDLYGSGGAVERAITQSWDAVGVQERTAPTAALLSAGVNLCTGTRPNWGVYAIVSGGASSLLISQWRVDSFNSAGASLGAEILPPAQFTQFFNQCGPGSDRVLAQTEACAALCVSRNGQTISSLQLSFSAVDDAGRTVTFSSPRAPLQPPQ